MTPKQEIQDMMHDHGFYERAQTITENGVLSYSVRWIRIKDGAEGPIAVSSEEGDAFVEAARLAIEQLLWLTS